MTDAIRDALVAARELAKLANELTGCRGDDEYVWGIEAKIDAALAALGEETAVKVRDLEWTEEVRDMWWIADRYRIEKCDGGGFALRVARDQSRAFETIVFGVSFEAAKAAAQADYERRIRSALVTPESRS